MKGFVALELLKKKTLKARVSVGGGKWGFSRSLVRGYDFQNGREINKKNKTKKLRNDQIGKQR